MATTGPQPIAVLLFSFKNAPSTGRDIRPMNYYRDLFTRTGTGGLPDFWMDVSNNNINFAGSRVFGWRQIPVTLAQFRDLGRVEKMSTVAKAFQPIVRFADFKHIICIPDRFSFDVFGGRFRLYLDGFQKVYGVVLGNTDTYTHNFYCHEFGHALGLPHTYDDRGESPTPDPNSEGEYWNGFDIMGGITVGSPYAINHPVFRRSGPGLNAKHTFQMGWLRSHQVLQLNRDHFTFGRRALYLVAANRYNFSAGTRAISIAYQDHHLKIERKYWIEMRQQADWDGGIPEPAVLIHREEGHILRLINADPENYRQHWKAGEVFKDDVNDIMIYVSHIYSNGASIIIDRNHSRVQDIPGSMGEFNDGAGIALGQFNSGRKDLMLFYIDARRNPDTGGPAQNRAFIRAGFEMDFRGKPRNWGPPMQVPDWPYWLNQGADIAIGKVTSDSMPDIVLFYIDNPFGPNKAFYRLGRNLDAKGQPSSWDPPREIPGYYGMQNQGAGVALADLNNNGRPDLVVFHIRKNQGRNEAFFRVGANIPTNGIVPASSWTEPIRVPGWDAENNHGGGIALHDLNGNGKLDLIVFGIEGHPEGNHGFFMVGHDLNPNGRVFEWSAKQDVRGWFGTDPQGGSIVVDEDIRFVQNGGPGMLIFHIDNLNGQNKGYLSNVYSLKENLF